MCTTVVGIPMREETLPLPADGNSDSSIQQRQHGKYYEVDLLHSRNANDALSLNGLNNRADADVSDKMIDETGAFFSKTKLNWINSKRLLNNDMVIHSYSII